MYFHFLLSEVGMQCVRFVVWHHVSSVYKLAVSACVYVCNQWVEEEGGCGLNSRVESLSHVAFLPVFRLLSGSNVVHGRIKQTQKTTLLPPACSCPKSHKDREKARVMQELVKLV